MASSELAAKANSGGVAPRPDGSFHRFLGVVSRTRSTDETCSECENYIPPHEGPAEFEYLIREIANALIEVGHGATYTDAATAVKVVTLSRRRASHW